jgi:hypothetical protein
MSRGEENVMKKLSLLSIITLLSVLTFSSCSEKTSCKIVVKETNIKGDINEFVKVVSGTYEIKRVPVERGLNYGAEDLFFPIKIKLTKSFDESKFNDYRGIENMVLQVNDAEAKTIAHFGFESRSDIDKVKALLKGIPGDEITVMFKHTNYDKKILSKVLNKARSIEITGADFNNPKTETN